MEWHIFTEDRRRSPGPTFRLPTSQGTTFGPDDQRQWSNLVLFFGHGMDCPHCQEALAELAARRIQYAAAEARVVPVMPNTASELASLNCLPFAIVADPEGKARRKYEEIVGAEDSGKVMFFVIDRFGAPYAATVLPEPDGPKLHGEILEWLDFIQVQCPECGIAEWLVEQ